MFSFNFHSVGDMRDVRLLIDFLSRQDLGYPNYQDWVQRTEAELDQGQKQAILAFAENHLVGNLVFQWHKGMRGILELKNLRLAPAIQGRGFARFLLKQVEADHRGFPITCDLRSSQTDMFAVLVRCGYVPTAKLSIYDDNHEDIVMVKYGSNDAKYGSSDYGEDGNV